VLVERHESKIERHVGDARIRFEDGENAEKRGYHEKRLLSAAQCQAPNVPSQV
jgi:hypothetical protein